MIPKIGHWFGHQLRKGSLLLRDSLALLGRVVFWKTPALDRAKGRFVTMVFSTLVLIWFIAGILHLVLPGFAARLDKSGQATEEIRSGAEGDSVAIARPEVRERLRGDLFAVPRTKKADVRQEPKTNPVELLRLIELQGVLGGPMPRAMILYKRTKETVTVSVGDDLGEFQVMEIGERSVVLKWRDELFELSL